MSRSESPDTISVFRQLGEDIFAPLLRSFALWLHEQALRDGVTQLLFLSRDGYTLQHAYQLVIPESEQIPSQYMYASRRLFNLAAIRALDEAALKFLLGDNVAMPVGRYLQRAGLDPQACLAQIAEAGFADGADTITEAGGEPRLERLFELLEREILGVAELERRRLKAYADSLTDWDLEHCAVIDIGWHGSLQRSLRGVLGLEPKDITGYYLGLHYGASRRGPDRMRAYLDESNPRDFWTYHNSLRRCVEIFELLFAETSGSIVGIEQTDEGFLPLRDTYTLPPRTLARLLAAQGAIRERLAADGGEVSRGEVLRNLTRLLSRPTAAEAAALGDIPHQEGFGGMGRLEQVARPRHDLPGYLRRPRLLAWDLRKTFWRSGFLARLRG